MKYLNYLPPILVVPLLFCLLPVILLAVMFIPMKWNPFVSKNHFEGMGD